MRIVYMLLVMLFISAQAMALGKISGKITDEKTGEAIIGATILVKGTSEGASTDVDGKYTINIQAGTYVVQVKYMGYQTKEVSDVHVTAEGTATVNVAISEAKSQELKEVVVRSSLKKENINALYTIQKNSATISDGISADVIKKSPDRSTGEVLKRVSGTTIQDNKFVIVRGLSDRYNVALVDNAILPSTEPNRKAFSFDIIPSAMIDNIIITKAATPDLPGDFAGGAINILTKETPDQNFNNLSIGFNYNTMSTGQQFKSGYRTSTDFLGFDNGARQLPSSFPSVNSIQTGNVNGQNAINAMQSLNNNYNITTHSALPGINLQGSLGRVYRLSNNRKFGVTAALTYTHNETIKKDLQRLYDNYDYTDNVYTYSTNLGALVNLGYYYGKNKITLKTLYNRIFDDNFLYREGINYSSTSDTRYYAYDLIQKSLFKTTLEGEHQVGNGQSKLNWILSYNLVTNNQPDQRKVSYSRPLGTTTDFAADNTSLGKANNRLFSDLNENILNAGVNYSMPVNLFEKSSIKVGLFGQMRSRDFSNRYIGMKIDPMSPDGASVRTRPVESLYANDVISNGTYILDDLTGDGDKYDATATTAAAYAMSDNKITDKVRVVWGARMESYTLKVNSSGTQVANNTWTDVLPSFNFTYSLNEKSNLRASYFRSVARPEFREIAPIGYYDYDLSATITGNPALVRSQIDNIDLRYEIFPGQGEILSASVFYKHFNKTLENNVYGQNSSYDIKPDNYAGARNVGVEVEVRKNLGFISKGSKLFKGLSLYANLAYINSKVTLNEAKYIQGKEITDRPLTGQSPYVINTSLGYTTEDGNFSVNLLYNRIGQRIFLVGGERLGNVYERPRDLLDFQASYSLSKKSELRLNVKDILSSKVFFYFDQNNNGKYDGVNYANGNLSSTDDWKLQQYTPGTTFSLTYIWKF